MFKVYLKVFMNIKKLSNSFTSQEEFFDKKKNFVLIKSIDFFRNYLECFIPNRKDIMLLMWGVFMILQQRLIIRINMQERAFKLFIKLSV